MESTLHGQTTTFRRYIQPLIDALADTERQAATAIGAQITFGHKLPDAMSGNITEIAQRARALREILTAYRSSLPASTKPEGQ